MTKKQRHELIHKFMSDEKTVSAIKQMSYQFPKMYALLLEGAKRMEALENIKKIEKGKKMETEEIWYRFGIDLVYNHAIYFRDLQDTVYGVLAEDANYMIKNGMDIKEIEKRLEMLKRIRI